MQINFQGGVDDVYDACVAKGSTPASKSLSDVIDGIMAIPTGITPSGTINITSNGSHNVTNYASANVAVPNSNSGTYTYASGSTGATVDLGATNTYRYVNASNVYTKGKTDGRTLSSESKTVWMESGSSSISFTFTFATKVVGVTAVSVSNKQFTIHQPQVSISGKVVTFKAGSGTTSPGSNVTITAVGY